jgi:soluble lytic murein transglycosylase-like protein
VAWQESSYRTTVVSVWGDYGLFQINPRFWPATVIRLFDPYYNARWARRIYNAGRHTWRFWAYRTRHRCGLH